MEKEVQRMNRIRDLLSDVPVEERKILKKVFVAKMSLRHGISTRTIDDYFNTLIDAEEVMFENKFIWKKNA